MQAAVVAVVRRVNMKDRHKIHLALKFLKAKLIEYRAEERRKVLLSICIQYYLKNTLLTGLRACTIQVVLFHVNS